MDDFPHIYRDDYVIPTDGFDTEDYYDVPVMMFSGRNEFSLFLNRENYFNDINRQVEQLNYAKQCQYDYCFKYGGLIYNIFNTPESANKMLSKSKLNANIYIAEIDYGSDVYADRYNYAPYYSFHGIFLTLWASASLSNLFNFSHLKIDNSKGYNELNTIFNHYINAFIQSGSPNNNSNVCTWLPWTEAHIDEGQSVLILDCNENKAITYMTNQHLTRQTLLKLM